MLDSFATGEKAEAMPDYSTLPTGILQMIMRNVAEPSENEAYMKKTISSHFLKCRRISKTLCMAATSILTSIMHKTGYDKYQVLHLPPRSGDLNKLKKGLSGPETMFGNQITSVVYHITTGQGREVDKDYAMEHFCRCDYGGSEDDQDSTVGSGTEERTCCRSSRKVSWNLATYKHQCHVQSKFAIYLGKHLAELQALLVSLPNLESVEVDIKEFWNKAPSLFYRSPSEMDAPAGSSYRQALPTLFDALSATQSSKLILKNFGSYAFAGLDPIRVFELSQKKQFLRNIVKLELDVCNRDNIEFIDGYDEPTASAIDQADRPSFLLYQLKNLEILSLSLSNEVAYAATNGYGTYRNDQGADKWLTEVLKRQSWPSLRILNIKGFKYCNDGKIIPLFLKRHKASLRAIVMDGMRFRGTELVELVKDMYEHMSLVDASIIIHKEHDLTPDLITMLEKDRVLSQTLAVPSLRVDIGALALKPQEVKVVELE